MSRDQGEGTYTSLYWAITSASAELMTLASVGASENGTGSTGQDTASEPLYRWAGGGGDTQERRHDP